MKQYRKKRSDLITAIQVTDDNEEDVRAFLAGSWYYTAHLSNKVLFHSFTTKNRGLNSAYVGSWITRDVDGDLHELKSEDFNDTYEEVRE